MHGKVQRRRSLLRSDGESLTFGQAVKLTGSNAVQRGEAGKASPTLHKGSLETVHLRCFLESRAGARGCI